MLFNQCRQECLQQIEDSVMTESGLVIHDVLRLFHGDGPAHQYEGGHKQGGTHSCVGCGAKTARFDDFAYCHHAEKRSLRECQEFVMRGIAWKKRGTTVLPYT